jgi:hypothetical protein
MTSFVQLVDDSRLLSDHSVAGSTATNEANEHETARVLSHALLVTPFRVTS